MHCKCSQTLRATLARMGSIRWVGVLLVAGTAAFALAPRAALAQDFHLVGARLQDRTQAALTLLSFSVTPDSSAS